MPNTEDINNSEQTENVASTDSVVANETESLSDINSESANEEEPEVDTIEESASDNEALSNDATENTSEEESIITTQEEMVTSAETRLGDGVKVKTVGIAFVIVLVLLLVVMIILYLQSIKEKKRKMQQRSRRSMTNSYEGITEIPNHGNDSVKVTITAAEIPYNIASVHDVGKRNAQQDSFGTSDVKCIGEIQERGFLAVVADGMGGLSDGDVISRMTVVNMLEQFECCTDCEVLPSTLLKLVYDTNEKVIGKIGEDNLGTSGSTLVAVALKGKELSWISVGDSHIYVYRDGHLRKVNKDHNYGSQLDEKVARGEISEEEALEAGQRNALTSYMGMGELAAVDQNEKPIALESGDRVLLMSDGVYGTISDVAICEFMKKPLNNAAILLDSSIRMADKSNQDNYTCVIIEIK